MKPGAQSILEQALTDAVARPMAELQRKNQIASGATLALSAAWIVTSLALVQAVERSGGLMEAKNILEAGFAVRTSPSPLESFLWPVRLEDGTTMYINLPRLVSREVSA